MKRNDEHTAEAFFKVIGQNIQQQRIATKKNFLEVESATRISAESITGYEKGQIPIPLVDLVKLAHFFGVSPALLLEGVPQMAEPAKATDYQAFSEAHVEEFQRNFLKVSGRGRGEKFKKFIRKLDDTDSENGPH